MRPDCLHYVYFCLGLDADVVEVVVAANFLAPEVQGVVPAIAGWTVVCIRYCLKLPLSDARHLRLEAENARDTDVALVRGHLNVVTVECSQFPIVQVTLHLLRLPRRIVLHFVLPNINLLRR